MGAGHAHVEILRRWGMAAPSDVQLTLISPDSETLYSGMLPGLISKQYKKSEIVLDAHYLAKNAGAIFMRDSVLGIDPEKQQLKLLTRPALSYDFVSFDIGSKAKSGNLDLNSRKIIATRPFKQLHEKLQFWDAEVAAGKRQHIACVGAGAAGFELALALRARYKGALCFITLIDASHKLSTLQKKILTKHGIEIISGAHMESAKESGSGQIRINLSGGEQLPADKLLWAAGPEAQSLFANLGDQQGFLLVNKFLQSEKYSNIFGAGDCISHKSYPWIDRAGVYAVREAPVLFHNLLAQVTSNKKLRAFVPQKKYLRLLNTSSGSAILDRWPFYFSAKMAWKLKDRIDRNFMKKYQPDLNAKPMLEPECGGCGGKVSSESLCNVLESINPNHQKNSDDVAIVDIAGGQLAVTVDQFKDFGVDPYLLGKIAAVGATSDLYAKGIEPQYALSLVGMPKFSSKLTETFLNQWMAGANAVFQPENIAVVGGQTNESTDWTAGFSLIAAKKERFWKKGPPAIGDDLILTKPLGSGILLAAAMQEVCVGDDLDLCLKEMEKSAHIAYSVFKEYPVSAATDITGFSFLGHLSEMLINGEISVELNWNAIPFYQGAIELYLKGYRSKMNVKNEQSFPVFGLEGQEKILYTPETAGGILAAVPKALSAECVEKLKKVGLQAAIVGNVARLTAKKISLLR